jgi:hypothetical protein
MVILRFLLRRLSHGYQTPHLVALSVLLLAFCYVCGRGIAPLLA